MYTVPKAPDEWRDREQLLDNNYRSMMKCLTSVKLINMIIVTDGFQEVSIGFYSFPRKLGEGFFRYSCR